MASSNLEDAAPTASFSYPPINQAYVARLNRIRAARQRRRRSFWSQRVVVAVFAILGFTALLSGSAWLLVTSSSTIIVEMGKNFSRIFTANSLFIQKIIVTNRFQNDGPIVYGFSTAPKLNEVLNWIEKYDISVPSQGYQGWDYWLNEGSQVAITYNITDASLSLLFVVVQGDDNMHQWTKDLSNADWVSSWSSIQGVGSFQYNVETNGRYIFALANLETKIIQVNVTLGLKGKVYNHDGFDTECCLSSATCAVHLNYFGSNALLLTTPQLDQEMDHTKNAPIKRSIHQDDYNYIWSVNVSFEQRWFTYLVFWGLMAIVMLILLTLCKPSWSDTDAAQVNPTHVPEATAPLLVSFEDNNKPPKAEQSSEACSIGNLDNDLEDAEEPENYLCIICFDQPRNCFFDPCGHCATCYSCSMKICKEKKAACPLCRQQIRVVRKIYVC